MRTQGADLAGVAALSLIVTVVLAAPVLLEPSTRVFGAELVGRHHDPFTVMQQFGSPLITGVYAQPVTEMVGVLLARVAGPVAAYNGLVLLSFPLAAMAGFLLARHLHLAPVTSALVALAFAFSPFHLAQAAYHPHIAQVQWIPLYLLALWRSLDKASPGRLVVLALALVAVVWSNFYGGLIAGVITPFAIVGYWWCRLRPQADAGWQVVRTVATLAVLTCGGMAYVWWTAPALWTAPNAFAFPRADLFAYSAKWWSYAVPPLNNPWWGDVAQRIWIAWEVDAGVLEQQVSVGLGVIALGVVAVASVWSRTASAPTRRIVPLLVLLAGVALVCSLSPERTIEGLRMVRPSALFYEVVPMFRAYARFGVVVQLMAVLLAGVGVERLWRTGRLTARTVAVALVALAAAEYAVLPSRLWRDVLPTAAHRWVMQQEDVALTLDCAPLTVESASIEWLTERRIRMATAETDCLTPALADWLAADGYSHLLVRPGTRLWHTETPASGIDGLTLIATIDGGRVFEVTTGMPRVYTAATENFSPREVNADWTWQWMGDPAAWVIVNTGETASVTGLTVELQAFGAPRHLVLTLNGVEVGVVPVDTARRVHTIAPFVVPPGRHRLTFSSREPPDVADTLLQNNDQRRLSFAVGGWRWVQEPSSP